MARCSAADAPTFAICPSRSRKSCAGCSRHCGSVAPAAAVGAAAPKTVAVAVGAVIACTDAGANAASVGDMRDSVGAPCCSVGCSVTPSATSVQTVNPCRPGILGSCIRTARARNFVFVERVRPSLISRMQHIIQQNASRGRSSRQAGVRACSALSKLNAYVGSRGSPLQAFDQRAAGLRIRAVHIDVVHAHAAGDFGEDVVK